MRRFDRGCVDYVSCVYEKTVGFPRDMIVCDLCTFCHTENSGTRFRCTETGEILPYHNKCIGWKCPLPINVDYTTKESEEEENDQLQRNEK